MPVKLDSFKAELEALKEVFEHDDFDFTGEESFRTTARRWFRASGWVDDHGVYVIRSAARTSRQIHGSSDC